MTVLLLLIMLMCIAWIMFFYWIMPSSCDDNDMGYSIEAYSEIGTPDVTYTCPLPRMEPVQESQSVEDQVDLPEHQLALDENAPYASDSTIVAMV